MPALCRLDIQDPHDRGMKKGAFAPFLFSCVRPIAGIDDLPSGGFSHQLHHVVRPQQRRRVHKVVGKLRYKEVLQLL